MPGENIKEFIGMNGSMAETGCECTICVERRIASEELDELIESHNHLEWLKETITVKSIIKLIDESEKLKEKIKELEKSRWSFGKPSTFDTGILPNDAHKHKFEIKDGYFYIDGIAVHEIE